MALWCFVFGSDIFKRIFSRKHSYIYVLAITEFIDFFQKLTSFTPLYAYLRFPINPYDCLYS